MAATNHIVLKPSELHACMAMAMRARKSLFIWGAPGIGKSQLVQQFADKYFPIASREKEHLEGLQDLALMTSDENLQRVLEARQKATTGQVNNLIDFRLSQVEPTDLRGIPVPVTFYVDAVTGEFVPDHAVTVERAVIKKTTTVWASPEVLTLPADWRGVIFMDEANGAMPIVQAAAYQLFLDRRIGECKLPEGAVIVAAGNRENDGGVTFQLATPLADRMTHVELGPDLNEWISNYAMPGLVHANTISYLKSRDSDFNTLSPEDPSVCKGASPRSWVTVSDYEKDEEHLARQGMGNERVLRAMIEGTVGVEIAGRYLAHRKMASKLPETMRILNGEIRDGNNIPGLTMDITLHFALCTNLVYKIVVLHKDFKQGGLDSKKFAVYAENFLRFLDTTYGTGANREMLMMATKSMFENRVYIASAMVPYYKEFACKYAEVIRGIMARV